MNKSDGFGHEKPGEGETNDWITPKWVIESFDKYAWKKSKDGCFFFLDPCASLTQPWSCARKSYTIEQDGLNQKWWGGHVWCNPPYGSHAAKWIKNLIQYGDGIALIFGRTETKLWQNYIFPSADGYLFANKRIKFCYPDGTESENTAGAPSVFISWGKQCTDALKWVCCEGLIEGAFLKRAVYTV